MKVTTDNSYILRLPCVDFFLSEENIRMLLNTVSRQAWTTIENIEESRGRSVEEKCSVEQLPIKTDGFTSAFHYKQLSSTPQNRLQ